jgi:hypothetical protein
LFRRLQRSRRACHKLQPPDQQAVADRVAPAGEDATERAMYGEIIKFRPDLGIGAIAAEVGRNYRFTKSDVVSSARDLVGENVDCIVEARRPRQTIVTSASLWTAFGDIRDCIANDR